MNVIQAAPKVQAKGSLYVDATINGKAITTVVDTRASYNLFLSRRHNNLVLGPLMEGDPSRQ